MAEVTGSLRRADMSANGLGVPRVVFYLPEATVAGSLSPGRITPTEPVYVIPDAEGLFTTQLFPTDSMLDNAFYKIRLEWISPSGTVGAVMDFPDWEIRVPTSGGSLEELTGRSGTGGGWANQRQVWVGMTAPRNPRRGTLWLQQDPSNPDAPGSTGNLYEWS